MEAGKFKLFITGLAMVTIQVQKTFNELGRMDIHIRCFVNDSNIERVRAIQLLRSNTNIVSVTEKGVFWQDEELQHRAFANGSVMNATSSYLHMEIVAQNVTTNDGGTYFCLSTDQYINGSIIPEETGKTFLNVTGKLILQL